jgi:uncharacterized protein YigE (DUF2233 family)
MPTRRDLWLIICLAVFCGSRALGVDFTPIEVAGTKITFCRVDPKKDRLELFLKDDSGHPFRSFDLLNRGLSKRGLHLLFAMNAGMFETNLEPVGLFVANGHEVAPLNLKQGSGNFFLKPNGVFLITPAGAQIISSDRYRGIPRQVELATQSGPMLVEDGEINPAFNPQSKSRLFRNGVGVTADGRVVFAIADSPIDFYDFALLFRDQMHCPNALFLDGTISSLYAPALGRDDRKGDLGPMIGVVR